MGNQEHPTYVTHDGYRWRVADEGTLDGRPAYELERHVIFRTEDIKKCGARRVSLVAFVSDCQPWRPAINGRRVLRDGQHVLEFIPREGKPALVNVRLVKSSKRWETSLDAIYSMTVKAHVALKKANRKLSRRRRLYCS